MAFIHFHPYSLYSQNAWSKRHPFMPSPTQAEQAPAFIPAAGQTARVNGLCNSGKFST
uniref:Uncharacterized protein n=1 Tax=Candidatus Nitrotoga fabula TaxID=2182327 RepID=A0A2X0R8B2_9PROT|nr:protein of unknown function [Candidatus Nitrotoga fabula]